MNTDDETWHLSIESFAGIAIGAHHVYGRIHQPDPRLSRVYPMEGRDRDLYSTVDVERPVTAEVARSLSDPDWDHPVGGTTKRFDDRDTLIAAAVAQWRELPARRGWTRARLVLGHPAYDPDDGHPVLDEFDLTKQETP